MPPPSPRERLRVELAQDADQLVAVLRRALRSDNDQVALKAAVTWLAKAHGKPAATHRIEMPARLLPETRDAMETELAALEARYGRKALRAGSASLTPSAASGRGTRHQGSADR